MAVKKSSLATREAPVAPRRSRTASVPPVDFQRHVLAALEAQDRMLEQAVQGYSTFSQDVHAMSKKVDKIEAAAEQQAKDQANVSRKVDAIHDTVFDPDKGLYGKVKQHDQVITNTSNRLSWFVGIVVAGVLTGVGKILFDVLSHLQYKP